MRRPPWSRLRTGAVVTAFLVAGWWIGDVTSDLTELAYRPHERTADLGEPVHASFATVTVEGVAGSAALYAVDENLLASPGLWVAVEFTVEPAREPTSIRWAELRDTQGRSYPMLPRNVLNCAESNPGIPVGCQAVIEVPPERLPGATIVLAENAIELVDELVYVDLGIDADVVEQWRAREEPLRVRPPWVRGQEPS